MKSSTAPSFWQAYQSLPPEVRAQARKTYRLWQLLELLSRARLGRALAPEHQGTLYWFWIGPHDQYERLLKS
jgi:hypothetical protein